MSRPVPPPRCAPESASALRQALQTLADEDEALFRAHFGRGQTVKVPDSFTDAFVRFREAGLGSLRRKRQVPHARVVPFFGRFIATDREDHKGTDQVFPLMFEQIYLVRNLGVREGDRVLELCVGSGANALAASDVAADVVGVDVNPRAIAFATFNRCLNEPAANVAYREGDLYAALPGDARFDLVFVNPPFELVPPDTDWYLHSHGGADGLDVIRRILDGLPGALASGGRFEVVTWSPGGESEIALVPLLGQALPGHDLLVHELDRVPMAQACTAFASAPGYADWQAQLRADGLTHVYFVFISATPANAAPQVRHVDPHEEAERCRAFARAFD